MVKNMQMIGKHCLIGSSGKGYADDWKALFDSNGDEYANDWRRFLRITIAMIRSYHSNSD